MDERPFFIREPKWQIVFAIVFGLIIYILLTILLGGAEKNQGAIILDFGLFFLAGIIIWTFFFGQFVLPVRTLDERLGVFIRLLRYLFGEHGPVTMIRNGKIEEKGHMREQGPGVVVLDTASAAMLRTDVAFTRPVGPGVAFTTFNAFNGTFEYIANAVDLHQQSVLLGPKIDSTESPFKDKSKNESDASFEERQRSRYATSGLTQNGIEIVPNILISFQLDCVPGQGNTQFGYDGEIVQKALTAEAIEPSRSSDDARQRIPWKNLPGALAVDVWRETIQLFSLDDLFRDLPAGVTMSTPPPTGANPPTAIKLISSRIHERLTQPIVDELDANGRRTGRPARSKEFDLLQSRGIRVTAAGLVKISLPPVIEDQLVNRWESTWLSRAKAEKGELEGQINDAKQAGNIEALEQFVTTGTRLIRPLLAGRNYSGRIVLRELLRSSLELIIRDPQLFPKAEKERQELLELVNWVERNPD
jgi:hypothetical protein